RRLRGEATRADAHDVAADSREIPHELRARLEFGPISRLAIRPLAEHLFDERISRRCGEERGPIPANAGHRADARAWTPLRLHKSRELRDALTRRRPACAA